MYAQVGDFCVLCSRGPATVPLTRILHNAFFFSSPKIRVMQGPSVALSFSCISIKMHSLMKQFHCNIGLCKFLPHENYRDWELQGKPAQSIEKGCKNHKETLCMLWINPVMFTDCGEKPL